jgi:hypothetical protein
MALGRLLLRLQLWATYDNTSRLRKRYMLLAGSVVYALIFLVYLLRGDAGPYSGLRHMEDFAPRAATLCILVGLVHSGAMILFVYLCRLARIANLYASMLLFSVAGLFLVGGLCAILAPQIEGPPLSSYAVGVAQVSLAGVAVAWLSLKLDSIFRKKSKSKDS